MSEPRPVDVDLATHTARVLVWGPDDGPLALLLHGFPDTAWTWRHLGPALAAEGWRVAAPFLRGYAPSGIPRDGCVTVGALASDAVGIAEALGADDRAVLVGHDWGAITASLLAAHPDSPFARVALLAVPPLGAMNPGRGVVAPWLGAVVRQPFLSWYIGLNQVPGVAERSFARLARTLWRRWSPGLDATEDLAHLATAVPDRAHARAVVSYYRAFLRPGPGAAAYRSWQRALMDLPRVPTLYLHGADDGCLTPRWLPVAARHVSRAELVPDAGHFLQLEQPDVVHHAVAHFLGAPAEPGR